MPQAIESQLEACASPGASYSTIVARLMAGASQRTSRLANWLERVPTRPFCA